MNPHFSRITPCFPVADISSTMAWYQQLGFRTDPFPEREPYVFGIMIRDNAEIMLQRIEGYEKPDIYAQRSGGVWDAYIQVAGVKEFYESVRNNVTVIKHLCQQPYGAWEFEVKDPNGYVLVFSEA